MKEKDRHQQGGENMMSYPLYWTRADGSRIRISDMSDRHLVSALRYARGDVRQALEDELRLRERACARARISPWRR